MPRSLTKLCDVIFDCLLHSQELILCGEIWKIFCTLDHELKQITDAKDIKQCEKLSHEIRNILVVLKFFPIELQVAVFGYTRIMSSFLSLFLDLKLCLMEKEEDKDAFLNQICEDIFVILREEPATIWRVIATSQGMNNLEILRKLIIRSIDRTCETKYDYEQYIRMIFVLKVFIRKSRTEQTNLNFDEIIQKALKLNHPKHLGDWIRHHYPGFGWRGMDDLAVHKSLITQKQPKGFISNLFARISDNDTIQVSGSLADLKRDESSTDSENDKPLRAEVLGDLKPRSPATILNNTLFDDSTEEEDEGESTMNGDNSKQKNTSARGQRSKATATTTKKKLENKNARKTDNITQSILEEFEKDSVGKDPIVELEDLRKTHPQLIPFLNKLKNQRRKVTNKRKKKF